MSEPIPPVPARDRRLFGPGPKAILSLDGGGVRGIVTIAFLERIESLLAEAGGRPVRLAEVFDLIGGTSTGAIIATGLALGLDVPQIRDFYLELAPRVFRRSYARWWAFWRAKFDAAHLRRELERLLGERTFDTPDLATGLGIITKRLDTGSAWIVTNNPRGRYWEDRDDARLGNRRYRLSTVVRASAAAPHFFDPELIPISQAGSTGLFVDGAVTPYNNPSLSLLMLATLPQHGIGWPLGPDRLLLVSVGTGSFRARLDPAAAGRSGAIGLAISALRAMIADNATMTLGLTQALGQTRTPWPINAEVGAMTGLQLPGGPLFETLRYDLRLEREWLRSELGRSLPDDAIAALRRLDEPGSVRDLYSMARDAAERQVRLEHLNALVGKIASDRS